MIQPIRTRIKNQEAAHPAKLSFIGVLSCRNFELLEQGTCFLVCEVSKS